MVNIRRDLGRSKVGTVAEGQAGRCQVGCEPRAEPARDCPNPRRAFLLQCSGPFRLCAEPHSLGEGLLFLVQLEKEKQGVKKSGNSDSSDSPRASYLAGPALSNFISYLI